MQNFLGNFECKLDSKGRLMIPAKFRHQLPETAPGMYVLSMGKEKCLNLYPVDEWNEMVVKKLHDLPAGRDKRQYIRFYSRKSMTLNIDKTGRVAIPSNFLQAIGNPRKVMVVGVLDYMEIWAPGDYSKMSEEGDSTFLEGDWEY
jgi:MraZ protein